MAAANLQTVIVSKRLARTRGAAQKLAQPHAREIYTSRQTEQSWRFRQRPPEDFVSGSFRTYHVPGHSGITLVYGKLKAKNPRGKKVIAGRQRHLQWKGQESLEDINRDWDFWLVIQDKIAKAKSQSMLQVLALSTRRRRVQSPTIKDLIMGAIADRARELRLLRTGPSPRADERYYETLVGDNPKKKRTRKKARKKAVKKRGKKEIGKWIKLRDPKIMPDPGPCSWDASALEFAIKPNGGKKPRWAKVDEKGNWLWEEGYKREWIWLWSEKYHCIIAVRRPRGIKGGPGRPRQKGEVIRAGGAAKSFERFSGRPAEQTQEIDLEGMPLQKWGDCVHFCYRSDKWESGNRKLTDYIHDTTTGEKVYVAPSIQRPQLILCFGGRLTKTERGYVF